MSDIKYVKQVVETIWKGAEVTVHFAAGAYLVEVVSDRISISEKSDAYKLFYDKFNSINEKATEAKDIIIFHKVFLYSTYGDQFTIDGTLHTAMAGWSDMGSVSMLSAGDVYVGIAEVDAHAHLYGAARPTLLRFVPLPSTENISTFDINQTYCEIEFEGNTCRTVNYRQFNGKANVWIVDVFD